MAAREHRDVARLARLDELVRRLAGHARAAEVSARTGTCTAGSSLGVERVGADGTAQAGRGRSARSRGSGSPRGGVLGVIGASQRAEDVGPARERAAVIFLRQVVPHLLEPVGVWVVGRGRVRRGALLQQCLKLLAVASRLAERRHGLLTTLELGRAQQRLEAGQVARKAPSPAEGTGKLARAASTGAPSFGSQAWSSGCPGAP